MNGAEFLAESKRIEEAAAPGPWGIDKYGEEVQSLPGTRDWETVIAGQDEQGGQSWSRDEDVEFIIHARAALPRMQEALEAVLALHRPMNNFGSPPCAQCLGDEGGESVFVLWPCPTVRAIESALAENGE